MNIRASDVQGASRLVITATAGITDLVEAMHHTVSSRQSRPDTAPPRTRGITGFVYASVRGMTKVVGGAIDLALWPLVAMLETPASSAEREAVVAALNGVLGDHLQETGNPLAIEMALRSNSFPFAVTDPARATALQPGRKLAIFVHGLCMNDQQWTRQDHNHGAALARDLGYTPLYLHYNSGLHISTNGRALACLLEETLAAWPQPVKEMVIVGHSMGGLVARSAWRHAALAGQRWPASLHKLVFLGTPHHGARLEQGGNWIDIVLGATPLLAPFARLGRVRSAGITDLRHGNLCDEDWIDRDRFGYTADHRCPVPLPDGVQCFALAASLGEPEPGCKGKLFGDGLVPISSALGHHARPEHRLALPQSHQWIGYGMSHLDLLSRPEVYAQLRSWLT